MAFGSFKDSGIPGNLSGAGYPRSMQTGVAMVQGKPVEAKDGGRNGAIPVVLAFQGAKRRPGIRSRGGDWRRPESKSDKRSAGKLCGPGSLFAATGGRT